MSKTSSSEATWTTRFAGYLDADQFIDLARDCMAATQPTIEFDANIARHTFNGFLRIDPLIIVLEKRGEIVGFLLARSRPCLFSDGQDLHQEAIFVREDCKSNEAEALLLQSMHNFTRQMTPVPVQTFLSVGAGSGDMRVYTHLECMGYRPSNVRMSLDASTAPSAAPAPDCCSRGAPLH